MATTQLTPEQLKAIFLGRSQSLVYFEAVQLYYKLRVHANGETPIWLIRDARPNESDAVMLYRRKIYEAETQNPIERVLGVLKKIRRSPDWMIRFDSEPPSIINKDETLEKYLTSNYPDYKSFEDWLFEEALKNAAIDANSIIAIIPKDLYVSSTEYKEPVACIYNADHVLQYVVDDYVILKTDEVSNLLTPEEQRQRIMSAAAINSTSQNLNPNYFDTFTLPAFTTAQVYYYINTQSYQRWEERADGNYELTEILFHNMDELPCFQMPGEFLKRLGINVLKKTHLSAMVPHLNKAARESNDLDAGVIMHLYLEKWRINNTSCKKCDGNSVIQTTAGPRPCPDCLNNPGYASGKSPFNEVLIRPAALGQQAIPTPPLGYVEKNVEIIKVQNDRVEQHLYKALAAVNMEHLADVQLNQSGTAKEFDRDEANAIVYAFATTLVNIANNSIYYINKLRNGDLIKDKEELASMLPIIPVPEKFDVINTTFLLAEYDSAKKSGINSTILSELQKEIAQKKFYANPKVSDFVKTVMECDPFPDKTIEEKALLEGQSLVTKEDIVLSTYIADFVMQEMEKNPDFGSLKYADKKDILKKYAEEKVKELSVVAPIVQDILAQGSAGGSVAGQPAQQLSMAQQQQQNLRTISSGISSVKRIGTTNI